MRVLTAQRQHIILVDVLADVLIQQRVITMMVQPLIMTMVHVKELLRANVIVRAMSLMRWMSAVAVVLKTAILMESVMMLTCALIPRRATTMRIQRRLVL